MRIILFLILILFLSNSRAQNIPDSAKSRSLTDTRSQNVLVVINGVEQKKRGIRQLDSLINPQDIESINILKDKTATDKYGEKGKDGVIEIMTKKKLKEVTITDIKLEEVKDNSDSNIVFTKAEVEAAFKGGINAWKNFLMQNLNANVPIKNKAPIGTYTVVVQFIVDKEGKLSDIRALTNHGYGMEEECIRVMKRSPDWLPAIQNGRVVKAYRKQPITFVVVKD